MNLAIRQESLQRELVLLQDIAAQKTVSPILSCVYIKAEEGKVVLSATDGEVSLTTTCDDNGLSISEEGIAVVDAKRFYDYVKSMDGNEVALSTDQQNWLNLSSGASRFRMPGRAADDFPQQPTLQEGAMKSQVPATGLASLIEGVTYAINEVVGKTLPGAYMEFTVSKDAGEVKPPIPAAIRFVATDGLRLSVATRTGEFTTPWDVMIPQKGLRAIASMARASVGGSVITLSKGQNHIFATDGRRILSSLLLAGTFPNWKTIFQKIKTEKFAAVDMKKLRTAISSAAMVLDGRGESGVKLNFDPSGVLHLEAVNLSDGGDYRGDIDIGYKVKDESSVEGKDLTVRVNHRYLLDFLTNARSSIIRVGGTNAANPLRLTDGDLRTEGFQCDYILMSINENIATAPPAPTEKKKTAEKKPEKVKQPEVPAESPEEAARRVLDSENEEEVW